MTVQWRADIADIEPALAWLLGEAWEASVFVYISALVAILTTVYRKTMICFHNLSRDPGIILVEMHEAWKY